MAVQSEQAAHNSTGAIRTPLASTAAELDWFDRLRRVHDLWGVGWVPRQAAALTLGCLRSNRNGQPARQHRPVRLNPLTGHLQTQLVKAAEGRQISAAEAGDRGSVVHVEVFQMSVEEPSTSEDLDPYARTDAPGTSTPPFVMSRYSGAFRRRPRVWTGAERSALALGWLDDPAATRPPGQRRAIAVVPATTAWAAAEAATPGIPPRFRRPIWQLGRQRPGWTANELPYSSS